MFIIEGTIGAGKTTFLSLIQKFRPEYTVSLEPINTWFSEEGSSLLHQFYADPNRWSYTMETVAMVSRVREYQNDMNKSLLKPFLMERSVYSGHYCFALNGFMQGFMTPTEWHAYEKLFNFLVLENCKQPTGFIYLRVMPDVAFQRIQQRNRSGESNISREYLQQLHDRHEELLIKKTIAKDLNVPVLVLDCTNDFEHDTTTLHKHLNDIDVFITRTRTPHKG